MEISALPYVSMILGTFGVSLAVLVSLIVSDHFNYQKKRRSTAARAQRACSRSPPN